MSTIDFICSKFIFKTNNLKIYDVVLKYFYKKTSIDHIMKKMIEFDKTRFVLFKEHEINAIKLMNLPNISLIYKKLQLDKLQELWGEFEFEEKSELLEIEKVETQFKKDNNTPIETRILELLDKKSSNFNSPNMKI